MSASVVVMFERSAAGMLTAHLLSGRDGILCGSTAATLGVAAADGDAPFGMHGGCLIAADERDAVIVGESKPAVIARKLVADLARGVPADPEPRPDPPRPESREPGRYDRRKVRIVIEAEVSLDEVDAAGPHPRTWSITDEIDRVAAHAISALGGWSSARTTDLQMTDLKGEFRR